MELKHVIPNMEKTFGNLEYAGEGKTEQRRVNAVSYTHLKGCEESVLRTMVEMRPERIVYVLSLIHI